MTGAQRTLSGRSEDVQRRSGAFRGFSETPEARRGRSEAAQRPLRGRLEDARRREKEPLKVFTGRSEAFKGGPEALRGRSEDVQATL